MTRIGSVALIVSDLDRSIDFYTRQMGLAVLERAGSEAALGADGETLLRLQAVPGAKKARGTTGLYHFAVLVPDRVALAQTLRRLAETGASVQGAADHGVSEAVYLADPDGNGIEIYHDRPEAEWTRDEAGRLDMVTDPLDIDGLLDELEGLPAAEAMPPGTRMGHVHLHVANLSQAELFYTGVLGLSLMQRYGGQAAFLSAEGYHHHVGINTWAGVGAPPPPPGSAGLRWFELRLGSPEQVEEIGRRLQTANRPVEQVDGSLRTSDPSGNGILITG